MRKAHAFYMRALSLTNQALGDSKLAADDSTTVTIILLSLFELIICADERSNEAWNTHMEGMAALIAYRGEAQFDNPRSMNVFEEAVAHLLIYCIYLKLPLPEKRFKVYVRRFPFPWRNLNHHGWRATPRLTC